MNTKCWLWCLCLLTIVLLCTLSTQPAVGCGGGGGGGILMQVSSGGGCGSGESCGRDDSDDTLLQTHSGRQISGTRSRFGQIVTIDRRYPIPPAVNDGNVLARPVTVQTGMASSDCDSSCDSSALTKRLDDLESRLASISDNASKENENRQAILKLYAEIKLLRQSNVDTVALTRQLAELNERINELSQQDSSGEDTIETQRNSQAIEALARRAELIEKNQAEIVSQLRDSAQLQQQLAGRMDTMNRTLANIPKEFDTIDKRLDESERAARELAIRIQRNESSSQEELLTSVEEATVRVRFNPLTGETVPLQ